MEYLNGVNRINLIIIKLMVLNTLESGIMGNSRVWELYRMIEGMRGRESGNLEPY